MTTVAALADQLAVRFRDPNKEIISCTQWYEYINQAWGEIQQTTSQWPWNKDYDDITVTVAANQQQGCLDASGEVLEVRSVLDATNNRPLRQSEGNGAFRQFEGNSATATTASPSYYRMKGNEIELYPTPSQAITLTVRAVKWSGTLAYNASPPLPAAWHNVLLNGAIALAHLDDGNIDAYKVNDDRFQTGIRNLLGSFLNGQGEKYPLMGVDSV